MQTVKKIILLAAVVFLAIVFASFALALVCVIILVLLMRRGWYGVREFFGGMFGRFSGGGERASNGAKVVDAEFEIIESSKSRPKDEG